MKICSLFFSAIILLVAGCNQKIEEQANTWNIKPSLITRVYTAYNNARNKALIKDGIFDAEEFLALASAGYANSDKIASRARGEMIFCNDGLNDAERNAIWPFDVEVAEAEAEKHLVLDAEGYYRLDPKTFPGEEEFPVVNDDGLVPTNPTIRWLNAQMEKWTVSTLDAKFERMPNEDILAMTGAESVDEGTYAWKIDNESRFLISPSDGAWDSKSYLYILWDGENDPCPVAAFDSFPNRYEAVAMLQAETKAEAIHNLAVLEWQHRIFRTEMNPQRVKIWLEQAEKLGIKEATQNLKILREHISEIF